MEDGKKSGVPVDRMRKREMRARITTGKTLVMLVLIFVTHGCGEDRVRLEGEGPVAAFERRDIWLSVFGGPRVNLQQLARMDKFGDFFPGLPPAATAIAEGPPDSILRPRGGEEYFVYRNDHGIFWVGSEEVADGSVGYPVYFFPFDSRPEAFLPDVVLKHVKINALDERVMIFECGVAKPSLLVLMKTGRVEKLIWYSLRELVLPAQ